MKKKSANIIIIICIVVIVVLSICLVMSKQESKNEIKEIDKKTAQEYIDKLINTKTYNILDNLKEEGLTDEIKLSLAINSTNNYEEIYTCNEAFTISSDYNGYRPVENEGFSCEDNGLKIRSYKYDDVLTSYRKLFGSIGNPKKGYTWGYDYSQKQNAYFKLSANFGPIQDINYKYDINSKEINDDRLTIDITYLSYYNKTINDEETYTTDLLEIDSFSKEKVEEIFNNNKDKLPHLTFTYINESDTYYLIDVK